MLTIKETQMEALGILTRENFEKNALLHLKKKYPGILGSKTDEEIMQVIKQGINKASSFNINKNAETIYFLEYCIVLGADFEKKEEHEWTWDILRIRNLSGTEKIRRMLENMVP